MYSKDDIESMRLELKDVLKRQSDISRFLSSDKFHTTPELQRCLLTEQCNSLAKYYVALKSHVDLLTDQGIDFPGARMHLNMSRLKESL